MNLSTVKWAQWDKTQSRELLVCSYVCALHCAQLLHTILHRTDLIIFPLTLQTITTAPMMSIWGKGEAHYLWCLFRSHSTMTDENQKLVHWGVAKSFDSYAIQHGRKPATYNVTHWVILFLPGSEYRKKHVNSLDAQTPTAIILLQQDTQFIAVQFGFIYTRSKLRVRYCF